MTRNPNLEILNKFEKKEETRLQLRLTCHSNDWHLAVCQYDEMYSQERVQERVMYESLRTVAVIQPFEFIGMRT